MGKGVRERLAGNGRQQEDACCGGPAMGAPASGIHRIGSAAIAATAKGGSSAGFLFFEHDGGQEKTEGEGGGEE